MLEPAVSRPPTHYWVAAGLALVWELIGVASYLMQAYGGGPAMQADMSDAQRTLQASMPAWVMGAFAIAVFTGLLGAIGLLVRKRWAGPAFIVSLLGALAQFSWVFLVGDAIALLGPSAAILPACIILVGVVLVWFARNAERKGWLS